MSGIALLYLRREPFRGVPKIQKKQSSSATRLPFISYSLFEASYCSIVLLCMITVVSPRLTLLEVVVMVRVTLQEVSITDSPIARAVKRVRRICFTYFFIVLSF